MKKYLPSKKFAIITLSMLLVLGISLFVVKKVSKKKGTLAQNIIATLVGEETTTIQGLIEKDGDGDGIPDWEEALWGTDPNSKSSHENVLDSDWITQKKKELAEKNPAEETASPRENLSETEKFSREFFATVTALKQSGSLDQGAVSNIANILGGKIQNTNLPENYRVTELKKTYDVTRESQAKFYEALAETFAKYRNEGLGDEFDSIDLTTQSTNTRELIKIGEAYQAFAKEVAEISVPSNLIANDLDIINSAYNTGLAVKSLSKMTEDPLVGLIGLAQYQKWSEQLVRSSEELRTYLIDSGIIMG